MDPSSNTSKSQHLTVITLLAVASAAALALSLGLLGADRQAEAGPTVEKPLPLWTPEQPALTVALDFPPLELVEVQVFYDEDDPQLKAAVELVSPRNKDRPEARRRAA